MIIELIKIENPGVSNWYCIKVDGNMVINSETGSLEVAQHLYDSIVEDPSILVTREIIVQSQSI